MRIGSPAFPRGDGADERGIQPAGQQKADLGVRYQPLFDAGDELFAYVGADRVKVVKAYLVHACDVVVADEAAVLIIVARRERKNFRTKSDEVFRLARKYDDAVVVIPVIKRSDADGVSGGYVGIRFAVIEDAGEFSVKHTEHGRAVFPVHRQQDLAVRAAGKRVFVGEGGLERLEAVNFAVADRVAAVQGEGLHARGRQPHNRKAVEAEQAAARIHHPAFVRPAGQRPFKAPPKRAVIGAAAAVAHNRTHRKSSVLCDLSGVSRRRRRAVGALACVLQGNPCARPAARLPCFGKPRSGGPRRFSAAGKRRAAAYFTPNSKSP